MGDIIEDHDPDALQAKRKAWAERLVSHCLEAEPPITAIAVTDHHDHCIGKYVRDAARGSNLVVFVGIEVTCSDNAQCLAIFDPGTDVGVINKFQNSLPGVPPHNDSLPRGPVVQHCNLTVLELAELIEKDEHIKPLCLLLPHFGDGAAHKTLNTPKAGPRFAALSTDGVYIEKPFSSLEPSTLDKVRGNIPEWGKRRRGLIATGDNRHDSFERIGLHDCWIKLGEPTIEALRQALLADEARIAYEAPQEPAERILALEVASSLTGEAPLSVAFNAGFTALVGGRGTGKSAILEYLRFGLGRTEADIPGTDGVQGQSREGKLIEDTLVGGYVEILLEREGVRETWRRELSSRDFITATDSNGATTRLTLDSARERFRARAFRQKGLSSLTSNQATAYDQITGIAAAEALARRREVDRAIANSKRAVATSLQQLVAYWQAELELKQAKDKLLDLNQRQAAVSAALSQSGVSEEHLSVMEKASTYARANAFLELVIDTIASAEGAIPAESLLEAPLPDKLLGEEFAHLHLLSQQVTEAKAVINQAYADARQALVVLKEAHRHAQSAHSVKALAVGEKLIEAHEAQTSHKALIDDSKRLSSDLADAEQAHGRALSRLNETKSYETSFLRARNEMSSLLARRQTILSEAAEQVADKSSGLLKARLGKDRSPAEYGAALQRLTEGSYITDAAQKCEDWVKAAISYDEHAWEKIVAELLAIYRLKISAGSPGEPGTEILARIKALFFQNSPVTDRQAGRIYANLSDSTLSDILAAVPQDRIVMKYVDESGKEMQFGQASPGQQASALLELLLRQSAGTLIIDQPEDDLDNRVIMKIVSLIRSSKSRRQLIFTTHNPNMVVNGDADKVVALNTREPRPGGSYSGPVISLRVDGAIETPDVRDYITNVIEGGREAFDLRSRKYGYDEKARA
nr:AAA family ATPase [Rhizobium laguerreae]